MTEQPQILLSNEKYISPWIAASYDDMYIMPIGAGNEVGRSCIFLSLKGKRILLDCGIHPGYQGISALPFFDEIDPAEIDLVLVTHYHLDHIASLPFFLERTGFHGKVYMTHPTKAIYKWLLMDYVKVSHISPEETIFTEKDLISSFDKINAVDYHQEIDVNGIRFTCYHAGHVLGAAMFHIDIGGVKVLYTGDYSREEDRHLMPAEVPPGRSPDVLICESTYGVQSHEPRLERERRFTTLVHDIVHRGGKCLLPVFALGKAQELLLILDEYWQAHPELHSVPIYYASALAKKCIAIYQTYLNMMHPSMRATSNNSNPFVFKHISNIKGMDELDETGGPCVLMASPGMLQNGLSRQAFDAWCSNSKNGVVISGYSVEGTLAKHILSGPTEVATLSGARVPLRMSVDYVSFSAHVDFIQNTQFIDQMKPKHLVLVHGESNEMFRLRNALQRKYDEREESAKTVIHTPRNCETVKLSFHGEKVVKIVGSLASSIIEEKGEKKSIPLSSAALIGKDFDYQIMDVKDIPKYTSMKCTTIHQQRYLCVNCPFELIQHHIERLVGGKHIKTSTMEENEISYRVLNVMDDIRIEEKNKKGMIMIQWISSPLNDMIVDGIITVMLSAESSPVSVKMTRHHEHKHDRSTMFEQVLVQHFSKVLRDPVNKDTFQIDVDGCIYSICLNSMSVELKDGNDGDDLLIRHVRDLLALFHMSVSEEIFVSS